MKKQYIHPAAHTITLSMTAALLQYSVNKYRKTLAPIIIGDDEEESLYIPFNEYEPE